MKEHLEALDSHIGLSGLRFDLLNPPSPPFPPRVYYSNLAFGPSHSDTFERSCVRAKPVPARRQDGRRLPRAPAWCFWDDELEPYEFGFNHPGQEDYNMAEVPDAFVEQLRSFLSEANLLDVLGICALGHSELTGRLGKTRGRINFMLPFVNPPNFDVNANPNHAAAVWSFSCRDGLKDATIFWHS
ncbi:uncharacterized protein NECHADRAFT_78026 [Fusarium vanettenii 77-13-4]|uniref:Uncharacterized protein n=1 Tax=Fusarium vanettenii (strain ATCC MYA-4622 / CBS 123669 / FGSC 9596 / NRRL 45880 / 77-13-4) TaxID=660122 RepID=C7YMX0_FUSV7|nr:uncharacterized protein NECHADRAFT_78026 [Fusarium vanettenii 77-13-4]EEU47022.1 predicted protein [Fusarium vanettenii 77-13-4]